MKTKTLRIVALTIIVFQMAVSLPAWAKDKDNDREHDEGRNDYAYIISSDKHWRSNGKDSDEHKWLRLFSKAGEVKSQDFKGIIKLPDQLRANTGLLREGISQAMLTIDGKIQCTYEAHLSKKFFNAHYGFISCNDGTRVGDQVRVDSNIAIYLKDMKGTASTIYASISVVEKIVKGIEIPHLDVTKGQILRFDGELWSPSNYIPDGQSAGDVLLWDGSTWMATKLSSTQGPKGDSGATGAQGDIGPQGAAGVEGLNGATGAMGPQGPAGIAGLTGATGATGMQGLAGAAGLNGAVGPMGPQGPAGDPGLVSLTAGNGIVGTTILGNGGTIAVNTGTGAGQIPQIDSTGKLSASILPDNNSAPKVVFIKDVKASGTTGGTCDPVKGWEQIRDLNSLSGDTSFASLAANQFTLGAGTYIIEAAAPAYLDGFHKAVVVNMNTQAFALVGSNARSHSLAGGMENSNISGQIVITAPTSFAIKHRCSSLMNNAGFGAATNFGVEEVYTQVKITKVK